MGTPNVWWLTVAMVALQVAFFVVLWYGVVALISLTSGWRRLARRYAAPPAGTSGAGGPWQTFHLTSARMNGARYRGCLTVTVGPEGIGLRPVALFRAGHPALLIPWSAVRGVATVDRGLLSGMLKLVVATDLGDDSPAVTLLLMPDVGRAVLAARPPEPAATAYGAAAPYPPPAARY